MTPGFRNTSPEDAPAVSDFLQRIFDLQPGSPLIAPRHLHWKCWEPRPDWEGSRGYVLTKDGRIVAHGTVVPLTCLSGGQRLKMIHLIDWAADPKSVGSGVTLLKQIARMVDGVVVVGGSAMTQKVLPALGFKVCGQVTRFVRPLRPLRRLADQKPSVRLGLQFARSLLWSLQAPSARVQGWQADRIAPEELASQATPRPRASKGTTVFERSNSVTAYYLNSPDVRMEHYLVSKDGTRSGYLLLAHTPWQTRIADFYVNAEDRSGWGALISLAVSEARRNPTAAELVSFGSDPETRRALLDCGFHARGDSALRILVRKGVDLPAGPIRFQMIDSDAAYLRTNTPNYCA